MRNARARKLSLTLLLGFFVFSGCAVEESPTDFATPQDDLTTWQYIHNFVSFPFRVIGAVIVYPLKFVFYDAPVFVYESFESDEPIDTTISDVESEDPEKRFEAARSLFETPNPAAVDTLVRALDKEPYTEIMFWQISALRRTGDQRALPAVLAKIDTDDPRISSAAVVSLPDLGDASLIEDIRKRMTVFGETSEQRIPYMICLARFGDLRIRDECFILLGNDSASVLLKSTALWCLGTLKDGSSLETIVRFLEDEDIRLTMSAATALGILGETEMMIEIAKDPKSGENESVSCIKNLAIYGSAEMFPDLLAVQRDNRGKENQRGFWAVYALSRLDYPEAIPLLTEELSSRAEVMLRVKAIEELSRLSGANLGSDPAAWRAWWIENRSAYLADPSKFHAPLRKDFLWLGIES
ncbi:MAG: hypothetical protein NUW37_15045 [Planctomycetes bacterium]|nr:hypothetical protein [Planctomycetota bacterium]